MLLPIQKMFEIQNSNNRINNFKSFNKQCKLEIHIPTNITSIEKKDFTIIILYNVLNNIKILMQILSITIIEIYLQ